MPFVQKQLENKVWNVFQEVILRLVLSFNLNFNGCKKKNPNVSHKVKTKNVFINKP